MEIISRIVSTGGLHEEGLADFFDGFGAGGSKNRILSIMKDSYIGCYGVIGLILYIGLLYLILANLPLALAGCIILAGDPFCKGVSSMIINKLPYVRKEEDAKNRVMYDKMSTSEFTYCLIAAILPL